MGHNGVATHSITLVIDIRNRAIRIGGHFGAPRQRPSPHARTTIESVGRRYPGANRARLPFESDPPPEPPRNSQSEANEENADFDLSQSPPNSDSSHATISQAWLSDMAAA